MSSKEQLVLPYKKCYAEKGRGNNYTIHLWDDGGIIRNLSGVIMLTKNLIMVNIKVSEVRS